MEWQKESGLKDDGKMGRKSCAEAHKQGFRIPPIPDLPGMTNSVIDISHHQGVVEFENVKAFGIRAVIQKATDGFHSKDATYNRNRGAAKEAGLLWAAYHYAQPGDGAVQAAHFWNYAQPDGNTVVAFDFEEPGVTIETALEFVDWILQKSGKHPMIYGGSLLKREVRAATSAQRAAINKCPLWLSQYTAPKKTHNPAGWDRYDFWQYTGNAKVDGISGACDRNFFNGSAEELRDFWGRNGV